MAKDDYVMDTSTNNACKKSKIFLRVPMLPKFGIVVLVLLLMIEHNLQCCYFLYCMQYFVILHVYVCDRYLT